MVQKGMHSDTISWRIIGHARAVRSLAVAARRDAPVHAYLLTGPSQVGKETLARELAAALNCTAPPDERPCHACGSCRMTGREAHPDYIVTRRSEDRRLQVEQVREARGSVDWRPYQGRFKVYLFVDAHEMSEAAANALLKTLEEPPPQVVVVLTATTAEATPQTVVSRCRVLPLQQVPATDLARGLTAFYGAPGETAGRLAALANGRPGWAVEALASPEMVRAREEAIERAIALSYGPLGTRLLLAGEACQGANFVESRARCLQTLEDMLLWWRDVLLAGANADVSPVHGNRREELTRQARGRGQARIVQGLRDIEATAGAVERNVTPRLALEALLLRLN